MLYSKENRIKIAKAESVVTQRETDNMKILAESFSAPTEFTIPA